MGAFACGALAVGAVAIGRLVIGRVAIGKARLGKLEIDELTVRKLRVLEPDASAGVAALPGARATPALAQDAQPDDDPRRRFSRNRTVDRS